jgi:hypothetical protein
MVFSANGSPVGQVVPAVVPQTSLKDVMRVHSGRITEHALAMIALENGFSEFVAGE